MLKKIMITVVSLSLILGIAFNSAAASFSDSQRELKENEKEKKAITTQKNKVKKTLLNDQNVRKSIIDNLEKKGYERSQIEAQIKDLENAIKTLDLAIAQVQTEYDEQLKLFQERVVVLYVQSRTKVDVDEVLNSSDFNEMFKKMHVLQLVSKFDQDLMTNLEKKQAEINELRALKEKEEENAQQQLEESLNIIKELEVSRSTAEDRITRSKQSLAVLEKAEDQLEKEAIELGGLVNKVASKGKYTGGIMQWPTPGYYGISSYFGYRIHPILKYKKYHGGLDINAPYNAYIHAAASGKVIWSGWRQGGSGNTVIIDHGGGISTFYLHIRDGGLLVKKGQTVKAGDVIAKVGSTGLSTGPHSHFEVRKNGVRQNPLNYVSNKK